MRKEFRLGLRDVQVHDDSRDDTDDRVQQEKSSIGTRSDQSADDRSKDNCQVEGHAQDAEALGAFFLRQDVCNDRRLGRTTHIGEKP